MAFAFHVEFGINDTPLTQALEKGNYASAERLILECPNASYLDDGCYQRTPLYICLCGVDEYHERVITRHFYLARLLIERGANVNHRVPVTNFGSEFISPGKSCLELLIDFYVELTRQPQEAEPHEAEPHLTRHPHYKIWNPMTELVVGLNRQFLLTKEDVMFDVQNLIFNVLRHGGNVNVLDENRTTAFHRVAMFSHDLSLLKLLHENGASLSSVDMTGNTPLLALCSVSPLFISDSYDVSPASETDLLEKSVFEDDWNFRVQVKPGFLSYLLEMKDTNVNHQNNYGQTALFHCILREDVRGARLLLEAGADPAIQGFVWESKKRKRKLSPLFVSFMTVPLQRASMHSCIYDLITRSPQPVSHLVDAGYFTTNDVVGELVHLIQHDFPEFTHLCPAARTLLQLVFGYRVASLKQLAARKVFKMCLIDSTACLHNILPVSSIQDNFRSEDLLSHPHKYEEYINLILNSTVLRQMVQLVQLPDNLLLHFEAHLLYLRMSLKFLNFQSQRSLHRRRVPRLFEDVNVDGGDSDDGSSGSDGSSSSYDTSSGGEEGGDSELEYW